MTLAHSFQSVPVGSISFIPEEDRMKYILLYEKVPQNIQSVLSSPDTGSYILGLARSYDIIEDQSPLIGFAILRVAVGEKPSTQLSTLLSTELNLPSEQAQKMALEIKHDIFAPVQDELDSFLASQKTSPNTVVTTAKQDKPHPTSPSGLRGARNVLDLKEITAAKKQEQLAAKPQTPLLTKERSGEVRKTILPPRPSTSPAYRQASSGQVPKFPLPPLPRRSSSEGGPKKPPVTPINLTGY